MLEPVIDQAWLAAHPDAFIADVRYYLDGRCGAAAYAAGHIPGAVFVSLEDHLAAPPSPAEGRHPLPAPADFAASMGTLGISADAVVVAYDDAGGAMAGRLVWLLRLLGQSAALLDGGMNTWAGQLTTEVNDVPPVTVAIRDWPADALASIDETVTNKAVIDARAAERYQGLHELIDPRAGHIPGARSYPFTGNLGPDSAFLSPEELRVRFADFDDATQVISYCGSGVSACHNLIAMERAGLGRGRLYVGSWSQYSHTDRPVATQE